MRTWVCLLAHGGLAEGVLQGGVSLRGVAADVTRVWRALQDYRDKVLESRREGKTTMRSSRRFFFLLIFPQSPGTSREI